MVGLVILVSLIAYVITLEETGFMFYKLYLDYTTDSGGQYKVNTNYDSSTWVAKHNRKIKSNNMLLIHHMLMNKKHQHMRTWAWTE